MTKSAKKLSAFLGYWGNQLIACQGDAALPVTGVTNDSRKVGPGSMFIAVSGASDDGHRYLDKALQAGAAVVVSERELDLPAGVAAVRVRDAYLAGALAAEVYYDFPARELSLVGITGTNGKTTVAYLLREIFAGLGEKCGLIGTIGYDFGCGLSAASHTTPDPFRLQEMFRRMVTEGCRQAVLEVSSHALAQHRLGRSRFAAVAFTNLSGDHLDYHLDMENYFLAKKELFLCLSDAETLMVINGDDRYGQRLCRELAGYPVSSWSWRSHRHNYYLRIVRESLKGLTCQLTGRNSAVRWRAPLLGRHNAENMAAVMLLARGLGVDWAAAAAGLRRSRGVPGRLQAVEFANGSLALVDYAHTDDALRRVLQTLKKIPHRRLLVVFGCGGDRDRSKRPRMGRIAAQLADLAIVTSDNPRSEDPAAIIAEILTGMPAAVRREIIPDRRRALALGVELLQPGDILLVAGKGHEDYQEIGGRREYFDDYQELLVLKAMVDKAGCSA